MVLRLSQQELGAAIGASRRTITRWSGGGAGRPSLRALRALATLLAPVDRALAEETASHLGATLAELGLLPAQPSAPNNATAASISSPRDVIDLVVCAAAESADTSPRAVRALLVVAFNRAHEVGLTVETAIAALTPAAPPPSAIEPKKGKKK